MTLNIQQLTEAWQRVDALAHDAVAPITDEASYDRALIALDDLLKQVGEDEQHPLGDLLEGLIGRVTAYQIAAQHVPPATGDMQLRLLMDKHQLTQQKLAAATGIAQGNLSKLINGKRPFTAEHARKLGQFFQVEAGVFL